MTFRAYFLGLDAAGREVFAQQASSSVGYLSLVAYGKKAMELGMADVLVHLGRGAFTIEDLPLTDRARKQHSIRSGAPTTAPGALDEARAA